MNAFVIHGEGIFTSISELILDDRLHLQVVPSYKIAQTIEFRAHSKAKPKSEYAKLLQNLGIEPTQCLTYEKPPQPVFSGFSYCTPEKNTQALGFCILLQSTTRGMPMCLVKENKDIGALAS